MTNQRPDLYIMGLLCLTPFKTDWKEQILHMIIGKCKKIKHSLYHSNRITFVHTPVAEVVLLLTHSTNIIAHNSIVAVVLSCSVIDNGEEMFSHSYPLHFHVNVTHLLLADTYKWIFCMPLGNLSWLSSLWFCIVWSLLRWRVIYIFYDIIEADINICLADSSRHDNIPSSKGHTC